MRFGSFRSIISLLTIFDDDDDKEHDDTDDNLAALPSNLNVFKDIVIACFYNS